MSIADNGGQAFPSDDYYGITRRQYYAAKAMQAMIPRVEDLGGGLVDACLANSGIKPGEFTDRTKDSPEMKKLELAVNDAWNQMFDAAAQRAFALADAMIRFEAKGST